ncbi:MAG: hypothetical protein ACI94Y_003140 [Maribacter sp.]|jgi:hypothetical protein
MFKLKYFGEIDSNNLDEDYTTSTSILEREIDIISIFFELFEGIGRKKQLKLLPSKEIEK